MNNTCAGSACRLSDVSGAGRELFTSSARRAPKPVLPWEPSKERMHSEAKARKATAEASAASSQDVHASS